MSFRVCIITGILLGVLSQTIQASLIPNAAKRSPLPVATAFVKSSHVEKRAPSPAITQRPKASIYFTSCANACTVSIQSDFIASRSAVDKYCDNYGDKPGNKNCFCANYVDYSDDVLESVGDCVSASCTAMPASLELDPFLDTYTTSVGQMCPLGIDSNAYTGEPDTPDTPSTTSSSSEKSSVATSSSSSGSVTSDMSTANRTVISTSSSSFSSDSYSTTQSDSSSSSTSSSTSNSTSTSSTSSSTSSSTDSRPSGSSESAASGTNPISIICGVAFGLLGVLSLLESLLL